MRESECNESIHNDSESPAEETITGIHDETLQRSARIEIMDSIRKLRDVKFNQSCHTDMAYDSCFDNYLSSSDNADLVTKEAQTSKEETE